MHLVGSISLRLRFGCSLTTICKSIIPPPLFLREKREDNQEGHNDDADVNEYAEHSPDVIILVQCLPRQDHKDDDISKVGDTQNVGKHGQEAGGFFLLELEADHSEHHQDNADEEAGERASHQLADQVLAIRCGFGHERTSIKASDGAGDRHHKCHHHSDFDQAGQGAIQDHHADRTGEEEGVVHRGVLAKIFSQRHYDEEGNSRGERDEQNGSISNQDSHWVEEAAA